VTEATVKLDQWWPQGKPQDDECWAIRQLVVESVFGCYYEKKKLLDQLGKPAQPVSLDEIYLRVQQRMDQLIRVGAWKWGWVSKRTVDRRVNEAVCTEYAENGMTKIVAFTSGFYIPNPALFEEKAKEELI